MNVGLALLEKLVYVLPPGHRAVNEGLATDLVAGDTSDAVLWNR